MLIPNTILGKVRLTILIAILIFVAIRGNVQVIYYYACYAPQEGDIIFQSLPHTELVDAIEGITQSPFSHCGVVLRKGGDWVVIEAIEDVRETPLFKWLQRGRHAGFSVYRLMTKYATSIPKFKNQLYIFLGKPYDYRYDMSDQEIYCSELIYKAFLKTTGEEMGELKRLDNLNWKPYTDYIRAIEGGNLPLDRLMITPIDLSRAPQLKEILRKGI